MYVDYHSNDTIFKSLLTAHLENLKKKPLYKLLQSLFVFRFEKYQRVVG